MKTAKDLAFKAYCDALKLAVYKVNKIKGEEINSIIDLEDVFITFNISSTELDNRFENWWSEWYNGNDHKDCFEAELSVFIKLRRYIQAE